MNKTKIEVDLDLAKMELMKAMSICALMSALENNCEVSALDVKMIGMDLFDKLRLIKSYAEL